MTLLAFDFDKTLSDSMMLVLLCEHCGVQEQNRAITRRVEAGELDYAESLRERVSLLADCPRTDAEAAFERVDLRPGARELVTSLQDADATTAIVTGGFERCVERVLSREGIEVDHVLANRLQIRDGALTGGVTGPLVEQTKDVPLSRLAAEGGHDEIVAVGDSMNDLPMLRVADVGIGFRPASELASHCDVVVSDMAELQQHLNDRAGISL